MLLVEDELVVLAPDVPYVVENDKGMTSYKVIADIFYVVYGADFIRPEMPRLILESQEGRFESLDYEVLKLSEYYSILQDFGPLALDILSEHEVIGGYLVPEDPTGVTPWFIIIGDSKLYGLDLCCARDGNNLLPLYMGVRPGAKLGPGNSLINTAYDNVVEAHVQIKSQLIAYRMRMTLKTEGRNIKILLGDVSWNAQFSEPWDGIVAMLYVWKEEGSQYWKLENLHDLIDRN
jgi:hypothetical protein